MIKWFKAWMSTARTKKYNSKAGPKVLPLFCQVYLLTTTKEKNDKGSWYVFSGPKFQGAVDSGLLADVKAFRDTVLADKAKVTRGGDAPVGDSDVPF